VAQYCCLGEKAKIAESYLNQEKEISLSGKPTHHLYNDKDDNKNFS